MLCFHNDCAHYKQYRIGCCPMFKSRCQYQPKPPQRYVPRHKKTYNKYGLSADQQKQLLRQQGYRCAICRDRLKAPQLDHNHQTNKARGYLCRTCNTRLSGFDSKWFIEKALAYLKNPPAQSL